MNEATHRTLQAGLAVEVEELGFLRAQIDRRAAQLTQALAHAAQREKNIAELRAALEGGVKPAAFGYSIKERCEDAVEAIRSGSASLCDVIKGKCPFEGMPGA